MGEEFSLKTAVVFCVFKNLNSARQVFERIREARPPRLYIVADAARNHVAGEKENVEAVRSYIEEHIDWSCEVFKNYAEENMGCGKRISSGLNWVFEKEEQAIILEDDCVPDPTFFQYCQEMLEHYKDDDRILTICGNNPYAGCYHSQADYLFSKMPFLWGWATWKRVWRIYDFDLKSFPQNRKNPVFKQILPVKARWIYMAEFEAMYRHEVDAWSYPLMYMGIVDNKFHIVPRESYVVNIGFHEEATHTLSMPKWMKQEAYPVRFPVNYREEMQWDEEFDRGYFKIANRHGHIVKLKQILGLNVNQSIFEKFRRNKRSRTC